MKIKKYFISSSNRNKYLHAHNAIEALNCEEDCIFANLDKMLRKDNSQIPPLARQNRSNTKPMQVIKKYLHYTIII